jgi:hypothetical protein
LSRGIPLHHPQWNSPKPSSTGRSPPLYLAEPPSHFVQHAAQLPQRFERLDQRIVRFGQ